jgi:serine/threonine protein kinase
MSVDFAKMQEVFLAAVEQHAPDQWDAYLARVCDGNEELRSQVARLLEAHRQEGSLPGRAALGMDRTGTYHPLSENAGTVIGPYRLMEQIGEGGMGLVFVAEQQQPVRRKVALKVIKPGMDTRQVIARFEAERQALALMDHPNIAKVHDGGATASGRPYFVMELVKGVPITEYCDQNQVPVRERLELFLNVCQAVQHAHQKGIIHRDLKPSNVLVMSQDGTPLVKVIDFGVAKAIGQRLTDRTIYTQFSQLIGTPLYMSPEQAGQSSVDVDTRSDIYSLGVLLYELLTGTTPFDKERLQQVGYDEIRRIILEEEPPRPSTRMSTLGQAAATVSTRRKSDPKQLSRLFRGELDWIVMKALEKDRNRRYESASAFAADVQLYLHDEPVLACPPSAWYRFRKFVRRNKRALATAAAVAMLAVLGLATGAWLLWQAKERTEQAYQGKATQWQRANENWRLAFKALDELYLGEAEAALPRVAHRQAEYRKRLEKGIAFYESFVKKNSGEPEVQRQTALASLRVAQLQDLLGNYGEAEKACRRAITLFEELFAQSPATADVGPERARGYSLLGDLLRSMGRGQEAEKALRHALGLQRGLLEKAPKNPDLQWSAALTWIALGQLLFEDGRFLEAEQARRAALNIQEPLATRFPRNQHYQRVLAAGYRGLAEVLEKKYLLQDAEAAYRRGLKINQSLVGNLATDLPWDRERLADDCANLARFLRSMGRTSEAGAFYGKAEKLLKGLADLFPAVPDYRSFRAESLVGLRNVLMDTGRRREAKEAHDLAGRLLDKLVKDCPEVPAYKGQLAGWYNNRGVMLTETHELPEAEEAYRRGLGLYKELEATDSDKPFYLSRLADTYANLGELLRLRRQFSAAEKAHLQSVKICERLSDRHPGIPAYRAELARSLYNLAVLLKTAGRSDEAEKVYRRVLGPFEKKQPGLPLADPDYRQNVAASYSNLGAIRLAARCPREADEAWQQALTIQRGVVQDLPKKARCQALLGFVLNNLAIRQRDNRAQARELYEQAVTALRTAVELAPQHPEYGPVLSGAYRGLGKILLRLKEHGELAKRADELASLFPERWEDLYSAAAFFENCQALAERDTKLPDPKRKALLQTWRRRTVELFRAASRNNPDRADVQVHLVRFLSLCPERTREDASQVLAMAQKLVKQQPRSGAYRGALGVALYRAGDSPGAVDALQQASQFPGGKTVDFDLFLAMARWQTGAKDQARKTYDSALEWMAENPLQVDDELRRLQAEAVTVLRIKNQPAAKDQLCSDCREGPLLT